MLRFESCLVDECESVVAKCSDLTDEQIAEILEEHPEWNKKCIEIW